MTFFYGKSATEELVWQSEEGDKTPENAIQVASWNGADPYVEMVVGTGPVSIPYAGWPQLTKEVWEAQQ